MGEKQRSSLLGCLICIMKMCEESEDGQKFTTPTPKAWFYVFSESFRFTSVLNNLLDGSSLSSNEGQKASFKVTQHFFLECF